MCYWMMFSHNCELIKAINQRNSNGNKLIVRLQVSVFYHIMQSREHITDESHIRTKVSPNISNFSVFFLNNVHCSVPNKNSLLSFKMKRDN